MMNIQKVVAIFFHALWTLSTKGEQELCSLGAHSLVGGKGGWLPNSQGDACMVKTDTEEQ